MFDTQLYQYNVEYSEYSMNLPHTKSMTLFAFGISNILFISYEKMRITRITSVQRKKSTARQK